jgi:L-aminopeptidase/D-esterase-like protein
VTAVPGLRIGHAADLAVKSGVTIILADEPAIAAVHVGGAAPATRETDLLRPGNTVERVDAIVLSGGSAFGLAAADGAMRWLAERGRGFAVGDIRVPIVPAACLFDLTNGGDKSQLTPDDVAPFYANLGFAACEAADKSAPLGSVGAGIGATTANLKGGFGAATATLADGATIVAFAAVNAVGSVTFGASPFFRAAAFEVGAEFGGLGLPSPPPSDAAEPMTKRPLSSQESTTLAVVATDRALTRAEAKRLAIAAHDGIALAIYPAHTPFDGDVVFALSTGREGAGSGPEGLAALCAAATSTLARAIAGAVYAAEPADGDRVPAWRERYAASPALPIDEP